MTLLHYTATVRNDHLLELPLEAQQLMKPGQTVEIDIRIDETHTTNANEDLLSMLRDVAELKRGMPESDPSLTDKIIRAGRAGEVYGR